MKKIIVVVGLALTALNISCGDKAKDPVQAATNQTQHSEVMKNWHSEKCVGSKFIPVSDTHYKIEYDFQGDSFVKRYNYYTDSNCSTQVAQISYTGRLEINNSSGEDDFNSKHVDLNYEKVTVKAVNEEGQKFLETIDLCGVESFPAGQEVDLTQNSTGNLCVLETSTNVKYYDRALVENSVLILATGFSEKPSNNEADKRPNIENKDDKFVER